MCYAGHIGAVAVLAFRDTVCPCGTHANLSLVLYRTLVSWTDPYKEQYVF